MSQGDKTPLEELSPRQEKLTELSSVGVCVSGRCLWPRRVLSAPPRPPGALERQVTPPPAHPLPPTHSFGAGRDGRPLPARTRRASWARREPNRARQSVPATPPSRARGPPGRDLPVPSGARAGRRRTAGRRLRRRELLHLLFVSLRVRRGSGTAQDPGTQTRGCPAPGDARPRAPRGPHRALRRTKFSPSGLKVAPKSCTTSTATTATTTTIVMMMMSIIIIEMGGAAPWGSTTKQR